MGFKILGNETYLVAQDASLPVVGKGINLSSHLGIAIQAKFQGAPEGAVMIQASCDNTQDEPNVINWTTIATAEVLAAGSKIFNCRDIYYKWIRLVYTPTAGAGQLDVSYTLKGEW